MMPPHTISDDKKVALRQQGKAVFVVPSDFAAVRTAETVDDFVPGSRKEMKWQSHMLIPVQAETLIAAGNVNDK